MTYLGCYKDSSKRDLRFRGFRDRRMTLEKCAARCRGYTYFSVQVTDFFMYLCLSQEIHDKCAKFYIPFWKIGLTMRVDVYVIVRTHRDRPLEF